MPAEWSAAIAMHVFLNHSHTVDTARVWVFSVTGGLLVLVGLWLFALGRRRGEGQTRLKILSIEITTATPSLALVVLGIASLAYGFTAPPSPPAADSGAATTAPPPQPQPQPQPTPLDVEGLNTEAVEAMRGGDLDRAEARLRKLLEWEGLQAHKYYRVVLNNMGHVAFRKGDRVRAQQFQDRGQGGQLANVLSWDKRCAGGDGEGCFQLGEHYRKIYVKNTVAYRATGAFAHAQYERGCQLQDAESCAERDRLAEIAR